MTNVLSTFVGHGGSAQDATDDATGKANEWLSCHQWRTADGLSCYNVSGTLTVTPSNEWGPRYFYVVMLYGPSEPTEPAKQGYTGATVRLG